MSRRPLIPPTASIGKAANRMAPGGRLWSEREVLPLYRPVGEGGEASASQPPTVWTQYSAHYGTSTGAPPSPWNMLPDGWETGTRTLDSLAGKEVLLLVAASAVADLSVSSDWTIVAEAGTRYNNLYWLVARAQWRADLDTMVTSTASGLNYGEIHSRIIVMDGSAAGWTATEASRRAGPEGSINLTLVQPTGDYRFQVLFAASAYANMWAIGPPPKFGTFCMGNLGGNVETYPVPSETQWVPIDPCYQAECDNGDYSHDSIGAYGIPTSVTYNVSWSAA